ncbi:MAG: ABC transporter permease [Alkalispirochaeta sp.]
MSSGDEQGVPRQPSAVRSRVRRKIRGAWALFRRELSSFFQTPVAYVVGVVFLAVTATLFFSVFFLFDRAEMRQFFGLLPLLLALLMPALAMRVVAEERRRGTWEVLATLPIGNGEVVVAKFAAVLVTGLFVMLPTVIFVGTVSSFGPLDMGPVAGGYLGAVLLTAVYSAVGVFASSVARNETVALILGLVIALGLALMEGFLVLIPAAAVSLVEYLSLGYHFSGFTRGVIDSRSVVYLLTVATAFLLLARYRLDRIR